MGAGERREVLLRILRDRPGVTAATLAELLGTSVRSVFRDVAHLRDRGYPIEASRGRGGGMALPSHWGLGRVPLSSDEAISILVGLSLAERLGMPLFGRGLRGARRKVVGAFPEGERRRLAPLRDRILVGPAASRAVAASYGVPDPGATARLQEAFVAERVLEVEYQRHDGARAVRRLEPHALVLNWPAWYLLAFDHLRREVRTFRLDRFLSATVTPETFRPRPHRILEAVEGIDPSDSATWRL